ncbi:conserved hypothetical protein [Talaromyces stipitatus ATCC 10500]|uniref:Uncharacterized protein n=1 Tax=Talaromyces stipitatus (strain ATCC 10500 / CBS 375.48 / QM 6759 / NRRL 1006) TaxID=441959 RepID=B8MSX9_TALSN|nr:uncharacterized protein TSTA_001650 [Talaromyces stipitatus ATCC 10500]EED12094.1 conserved hypothetical protein [Talaromyces stipitatus ATCC 10500]
MAPSNLLSVSLIVVTIISYIPQYQCLLTVGSSAGISIASILTMTLVAQVQMATMYYLFKSAPLMEYGVPISTPPSTRDWLNLSQILIQWICSLFLFALIIYLPTSTTRPGPASSVLSKKVAVSLWILHVLSFILSVVAGGRPQDVAFNIIRNINATVINPLFTLMAVVAFFYQVRVMPSAGHPNALSNWTLGLHFFTFLLLAISWPFRLILPPNMWQLGSKPAILLEWYPWVGWACVNNAIFAIDQGMILLYSGRIGFDGTIKFTDERRPLINPEERTLDT